MPSLSASVIVNVEASYIETYLKQKGFSRNEEQKGQKLQYWVDKLMQDKKIDIPDFENFLFEELFWGKRKHLRIYKLETVKNIKFSNDWLEKLQEKYNVNSLNFVSILDTFVTAQNNKKIAAIISEENYKGELTRLQILFVVYAQVYEEQQFKDTSAYIPVDIDFEKKSMIIKAWNRNGLVEGNRPDTIMDNIKKIMSLSFDVKTKNFQFRHKKVLYNMSQGLIGDIYVKIPAFNEISELKETIKKFEQNVFASLSLEHVREEKKEGTENRLKLEEGVLDFEDEIHKVVEKLVVSDYFYDMPYEEVWNMGIDTIISKIRFNDVEHVLTSLNGDDTEMPIFCTKTFMALKKSIEDAKLVERLWIVKNRIRGKLGLKFDATKEEYLEILILSHIRFKQDDLTTAMEIYRKYGSGNIKPVTKTSERNIV